ncbi:MAG: SMI1/KNR4 family protein, partial [Planctomycetota bacterium]
MAIIFGDFDTTGFWEDCEYAAEHYVETPPTDELITELESHLGYKIPRSYIELANTQNGGSPNNTCCPT